MFNERNFQYEKWYTYKQNTRCIFTNRENKRRHRHEYTDIVDLLLGWVGSNGEKIDSSILPTTYDPFEEYDQVIGKLI